MNEKSLHILIIGFTWPEPQSSAAGTRMMQIIDLFRKVGWEVSFYSPAQKRPHSENLEIRGVKTGYIEANTQKTAGFFKEKRPDVVVFDRFMIEEQFGWRVAEECPNALRILDTEDLHFLRKAREKAVKEGRKLRDFDFFSETAKREIASILRCDLSLVISEVEVELLKNKFGIVPELIEYLPFLVENPESWEEKDIPTFEQRKDFFFIGNYFHKPNYDAVVVLKNKIWPILRKRCPDASLFVYGAYTERSIRQLENKGENFIVQGRAKDLKEIFQKHRLLLAPLRFGAGLKGKILDAMQFGIPTITTPVGAEGINGKLPFCGKICENNIGFIDTAQDLYDDQSKWETAQQNGQEILKQRFDRAAFESDFLKKIQERRADLLAYRQRNFYGQLLLHHRLQSTKYLSRWIETKNNLMNLEK